MGGGRTQGRMACSIGVLSFEFHLQEAPQTPVPKVNWEIPCYLARRKRVGFRVSCLQKGGCNQNPALFHLHLHPIFRAI